MSFRNPAPFKSKYLFLFMKLNRVAAISLLVILACRPAEKAPEVPPAPGTLEHGTWRALGTEPFWHLDLTPTGLRFTTPEDTLGIVTPPVTPRLEGDTTRWTGKTERTAFDVRIWPGSCSDGMSDRVWPAAALVQIDGRTWRGCAEALP